MASVAQGPSKTSTASKKSAKVTEMPETLLSALTAMNERVCYVHEGSKIAEIAPNRIRNYKIPLIDCNTFKYEAYSTIRVGDKSVAQAWMNWPSRRTVHRRVYIPNAPRFVDGNLNMWFPSPSIPKKGDISLFHTYMAGMMESDPIYLDWITAWLAYHVQFPAKKMLTGVMFWSHEAGNGKSTLGYLMRKIHGEHNSFLLRTKFPDRFNSFAENTLFGWIDELMPVRKSGQSDAIKSMITQPRILIENKRERPYEQDDIISYYFTSNHPNALDLGEDDRRFFVHNVGRNSLTRAWFETVFRPWLDKPDSIDAIHYYLKHEVDLSKPIIGGNPESLTPAPFDPAKIAPRNDARLQAIRENRDDMEAWIWELRENPTAILGESGAHRTIFTSSELFTLFLEQNPHVKGASRQGFQNRLSEACVKLCKGEALRMDDGTRPRFYSTDPAKKDWEPSQVKLCLSQELDGQPVTPETSPNQ